MTVRETIDKPAGTMTLMVEGEEVNIPSGHYMRSMDMGIDSMTATVPYQRYQNAKLDEAFRPYSYADAALYLGPDLQMVGKLYRADPSISSGGQVVAVEMFQATADVFDSSLNPPYEFNNLKLSQIAEKLLKSFNIKAIFEGSEGGKFERVTAEESEKVLAFLMKLSAQRGLIVSTNTKGELVFRAAKTTGMPVATFVEGQPGFTELRGSFDGRARFNSIKVVSTEPDNNNRSTETDSRIPSTRGIIIRMDDTNGGNIKTAARYHLNKTIAKSIAISIPVADWYDDASELWRENTFVAIQAPTLYIDEAYNMLIRSVEFAMEPGGRTATLDVVPPEVYTNGEVREPWVK